MYGLGVVVVSGLVGRELAYGLASGLGCGWLVNGLGGGGDGGSCPMVGPLVFGSRQSVGVLFQVCVERSPRGQEGRGMCGHFGVGCHVVWGPPIPLVLPVFCPGGLCCW